VDRIVAIALSCATGESIATRVMERDILYPYLSIYLYFLSLSFVVTMRSESISMYDTIVPILFLSDSFRLSPKEIIKEFRNIFFKRKEKEEMAVH
jgi:hypothetical protein